MECTKKQGVVFDAGSLYANFQTLKDSRNPKGLRYRLADLLVMRVIAKICGKDTPSRISDWVKHRIKSWLKLEPETMPHHSTYRRICETVLDVEALEEIVSRFLNDKRSLGKQVLVSIDGKVLRGTLDNEQQIPIKPIGAPRQPSRLSRCHLEGRSNSYIQKTSRSGHGMDQ